MRICLRSRSFRLRRPAMKEVSTSRKAARLCTIIALALFSSPALADGLLNGSFEDSANNWNPSGNLAVIGNQGETDGAFALAFSWGNLPSDGEIWQSFATVAGLTYRLSFDFGKYSINQPNQVARLDVDVYDGADFAGTVLLDTTVTDSTPGPGDPNSTDSPAVYDPYAFDFSAPGTTATLRFRDTSDAQVSGGGFDAMLDHVGVAVVPEPATSALFIGAAGALAWIIARMRRI